MTTQVDDRDILVAIANRDSEALMSLYDRYNRLAFALAYRIVNDASLAEEVVQDAFFQVWNRAGSFDHDRSGNVRGWLMTIVHHRAIDFRRRNIDRRPPHVPLEDVDYVLSTPDVWGEIAHLLTQERMREAVSSLPDDQRRTIELAFYVGMSHGEIAERENAPLGTVKGRLRLGLRKLKTVLSSPAEQSGFSDILHEDGPSQESSQRE